MSLLIIFLNLQSLSLFVSYFCPTFWFNLWGIALLFEMRSKQLPTKHNCVTYRREVSVQGHRWHCRSHATDYVTRNAQGKCLIEISTDGESNTSRNWPRGQWSIITCERRRLYAESSIIQTSCCKVWRHTVGNYVRTITENFDSINICFASSLPLLVHFAMEINFQNIRTKNFYQHFSFGRSRLRCGVQYTTTKISLCAPWHNLLLRMYLREGVQVFLVWILRQSVIRRRNVEVEGSCYEESGRFKRSACMCVLDALQKWA